MYHEELKILNFFQNNCYTRYDSIPVSFIKLVVEDIASPLTYIINNLIIVSKSMENCLYKPDTKSLQSNRVDRLSTNINPSNFIKNSREKYSATNNRLHESATSLQVSIWLLQKPLNCYRSSKTIFQCQMKCSELTMAVFTCYLKDFDTTDFYNFYTFK